MELDQSPIAAAPPPPPPDDQSTVVALSNGVDGRQTAVDGGVTADDGNRLPRLPRWTRHEILVLIQGKRVAESRVRRGRTGTGSGTGAGSAGFGSNQLEPKWAYISSYCKRHGVNRGPVQCRKRWSNLAGDFKKIKEWESQATEDSQSFWVMRNDLRKERKLPGFFDKEVYDILDGGEITLPETVAGTVELKAPGPATEDEWTVFDSGRTAATDYGLFSDFEQSRHEEEDAGDSPEKGIVAGESPKESIPAPTPISEKRYQPFVREYFCQANEKVSSPNPERVFASNEGRKRRRVSDNEVNVNVNEMNLPDQLVKILERNNRMLAAQLQAQNMNYQLDRDQRKEQADGLISVLNKLADAIGRIADKM